MPAKKRWSMNMGGQLIQVPQPLGYSATSSFTGGDGTSPSSSSNSAQDSALAKLRLKKLWEAARSPLSGVLMSGAMMFMIGNNIQIFPLIMLGMTCMNAFKGLFAVTKGLLFSLSLFFCYITVFIRITFVCTCFVCSVRTIL